jgi:phage terminase small subunit
MPRTSAASAAIPTGATSRLRPPDDLTGPERALFVDLVASCSANHFQSSDAPLLSAYCRAVVLEKVASAAAGYVADGKPSGWLNVLAQATRSLTVLSSELKLTPLSRQSARPEGPISYYERLSLEASRDPEPN